MKSFRTFDLAIEFGQLVGSIHLKGHLNDQLQRAASSIALNLAEGNAKGSAKEKRSFFHTALGSLRECQAIFKLAKVEDTVLLGTADALGANLYKLVNSELKNSPSWQKNL